MNHLVSSLSLLSALAVVCGLVACGAQPQPKMPSNANVAPPTPEPYARATSAAAAGQPQTPAADRPSGSPATSQPGSSEYVPSAYSQAAAFGTLESARSEFSATEPMGAIALDAWPLDDAQIAAVISAINQNEIQEGQLAETSAASAQVRRFAEWLVTAHRTMLTHDTAVLLQAQIVPYNNVVSDRMNDNVKSKMATLQNLQSLHSDEFDRCYIDDQVQAHKKALEFLDQVLNRVQNADFKADLESAVPQVQAQWRMAERIQQDLGLGAIAPTSTQTGKSARNP